MKPTIMMPVYDVRRFDSRFDLIVVAGMELGFLFHDTMPLGDGTELLLGNTFGEVQYTVSAMTLDELVIALIAKTLEVANV